MIAIMATIGIVTEQVSAEPRTVVTKTKNSIKNRADNAVDTCDAGGGDATVTTVGRPGKGPFGGTTYSSTVTCSGGDFDGMNCTFTKGKTSCTSAFVAPEQDISGAVTDVSVVQSEPAGDTGVVVVDTGAPVVQVELAVELPAPSPTVEPTVIDPIPTGVVEEVQVEAEPSPTVVIVDHLEVVDIQPVIVEQAP
jgi:hypothetical protein